MKLKLLGRRIRLRKCYNDHIRDKKGNVLIYRTDWDVDTTTVDEIVDVADGCREFSKADIGKFVVGPETHNGLHGIGASEFIADEDIFLDEHGGKPYFIAQ